MAITNAAFRTRVRLLAGIDQEELDNDNLDVLSEIASEWFNEQTGGTFVINANATDDNAVMYYTCFLSCLSLNGVGIDRIQVGDLSVYYSNDDYGIWETMASQQLIMKNALSIKTTTYNADPYLGNVNWDKNVTGVDATKDMYPSVRGMSYDAY